MTNYDAKWLVVWGEAVELIGGVKALLFWSRTYTTFDERFSEQRLEKFNRMINAMRTV